MSEKSVTCKSCGAVLSPEHGIIQPNEQTGVTYWVCGCGRRVREQWKIENNIIITLSTIEV